MTRIRSAVVGLVAATAGAAALVAAAPAGAQFANSLSIDPTSLVVLSSRRRARA